MMSEQRTAAQLPYTQHHYLREEGQPHLASSQP